MKGLAAMTKNPVLTISLLCSGREGTKKCLDSLRVLRERVPSELILVDTGCDEKMRQLLFSYADVVVPFAWCNDFSRARNAGLEKAHGEWFLYLDDDENFLDTEEIEAFFLSGEYKNFGRAAYTVRNFLDEGLKNYQDTLVIRLHTLKNRGRFRGAVHEEFMPIQDPVKTLNSIAEHTGYLYRTPEDKIKHSMRNVMLLEKAILEENDGDAGNMMRLRAHLAPEYLELKEYEKLEAFCGETLQKFEKQDDRDCNRHRGCFYSGKILAEIFLEEYEAAYQTYTEAVSDKRNTEYTVAYLMTQGAGLFWRRGEKEKTAMCCKRYLKLCEYYEERPEERLAEQTFFVITAFYDETRSRMYCYQICIDLEKGNTSSLRDYFDPLDWEKDVVYMTEDFMPCLVRAMAKLPYEEIFMHAADVLANKPGMDNFWDEIDKIENEAEVRQLIGILSETAGEFGEGAGRYLREMQAAEEEDDWERFSAVLKKAAMACPQLGGILKRYARFYGEKRLRDAGKANRIEKEILNRSDVSESGGQAAGESGNGQNTVSPEMQALAEQIKAQINVLLSQGMKKEALQVLGQLKTFMPKDEELSKLELRLGGETQNSEE